MNNKYLIYSLLLPALLFLSCAQEDGLDSMNSKGILFHPALRTTDGRSNNTTTASTLADGFYVSSVCPESVGANGILAEHFSNFYITPVEGKSGVYSDDNCLWPSTLDGKSGKLRFFAFYPSLQAMSDSAQTSLNDGYFALKNESKSTGYNYRIDNFRISSNIGRHVDFVTATTEGSQRANSKTGVTLAFEHQLSRVALKAWCNSKSYDIEIAGVRIGRCMVQGNFNFTGTPANNLKGVNLNGSWTNTVAGSVEYIYSEGESVIRMTSDSHGSEAQAASIMGNGGWAMLVPSAHTAWNKTAADTRGLHFSVLMRIIDISESRFGTLLYPYAEDAVLSAGITADMMNVVYLSVDNATGKIMKRVYKNGNTYYSDAACSVVYSVPANEEVRSYGWVAIPVSPTWKAGSQYTYVLDFTNGAGFQDPTDAVPGAPIIAQTAVGVEEDETVQVPSVNDFEENEDNETDLGNNITIE